MRTPSVEASGRPVVAAVLATLLVVAGCEDRKSAPPAVKNPAPATSEPSTDVPVKAAPSPSTTPASPAPSTPVAPAAPSADSQKSEDPYPKGVTTAEGVACDLARAFIAADESLFRASCVKAAGPFQKPEYATFLDENAQGMKDARAKGIENAGGPKQITRVYQFRHLTKNGPGSFVFAASLGKDIGFVDVVAELHQGGTFTSRTLVLQLDSGEWRVIPEPSLFPLLSDGLNDETDSTVEWKKGG